MIAACFVTDALRRIDQYIDQLDAGTDCLYCDMCHEGASVQWNILTV